MIFNLLNTAFALNSPACFSMRAIAWQTLFLHLDSPNDPAIDL
jgi:hypothetical protein